MIVIVNYNMGNLYSVKKKLDRLQIESIVSSDPDDIMNAEKLILPGVGHFGKAMNNLQELGLIEALNHAVLNKKIPILGICLGMQLMAKASFESENNSACEGLGWLDAEVIKFQVNDTLRFKIPHTGWNTIQTHKESPLMNNIENDSEFYFVHSYHFKANDPSIVLNTTNYCGNFVSAVSKDLIFGVQYHPEKSHDTGIQLLANFVGLG
jgi:glutamine amidotransferase